MTLEEFRKKLERVRELDAAGDHEAAHKLEDETAKAVLLAAADATRNWRPMVYEMLDQLDIGVANGRHRYAS